MSDWNFTEVFIAMLVAVKCRYHLINNVVYINKIHNNARVIDANRKIIRYIVADMGDGLAKKLYSTYLTYLPKERFAYPLKMNVDERGSFTEFIRTADRGQVAVNISKPGITKGEHWHHTKVEKFVVVSGHGLIQMRKVDSDEVVNFEVSGDKIEVVETIPGYTHNIVNLSETENLVTLIWCNECFDPNRPDTYFDKVVK